MTEFPLSLTGSKDKSEQPASTNDPQLESAKKKSKRKKAKNSKSSSSRQDSPYDILEYVIRRVDPPQPLPQKYFFLSFPPAIC
jgi:hypothetical protein